MIEFAIQLMHIIISAASKRHPFFNAKTTKGPVHPRTDPAKDSSPEDKTERTEHSLILLLPFPGDVAVARYHGNRAVDEDVTETGDDAGSQGYTQKKDIDVVLAGFDDGRRNGER